MNADVRFKPDTSFPFLCKGSDAVSRYFGEPVAMMDERMIMYVEDEKEKEPMAQKDEKPGISTAEAAERLGIGKQYVSALVSAWCRAQ